MHGYTEMLLCRRGLLVGDLLLRDDAYIGTMTDMLGKLLCRRGLLVGHLLLRVWGYDGGYMGRRLAVVAWGVISYWGSGAMTRDTGDAALPCWSSVVGLFIHRRRAATRDEQDTANSSLIPDGSALLQNYSVGKGEARTTTEHRIILSIIVPAG
jgi:hypothetical protein